MRQFLRFIMTHSVFMNIIFIGAVLFGAFVAIPNIPIDRYPNIKFGEVQIMTSWPGASAQDVERLITRELEDSLRGMNNIEFVSCRSLVGQSNMRVKFIDDTDYDALYDELRLRILGQQNRLPIAYGKPLQPVMQEIDVDEWLPVIQMNVIPSNNDMPRDKRSLTLLAKEFRTHLENIPGVKEVVLIGDEYQQYQITVDEQALERHRLTITDVATALENSGSSTPGGTVQTSAGQQTVEINTRYEQPEDLYNIVVRRDGDGSFITVHDLIIHEESGIRPLSNSVIVTVNGRDSVGCKVLKESTANSETITQAVHQTTQTFLASHPHDDIDIIPTLDSTQKINDSMSVLSNSLIGGTILIGAVLFFFLSLRSAVLTVTGVLFSFLVSLIVFYSIGYSLNEISLLGFVLVIGIIVDDAIIVLENIQRHREAGESLMSAVTNGTAEVFWPIVSATLTSCASFLPLLIMTGAIGDFFSLIPIAVGTALFISLFECLFILPLHIVDAEKMLGPEKLKDKEVDESNALAYMQKNGLVGKLHTVYDRLLQWNIHNPFKAFSVSVGLFFVAIGILIWSNIAPFYGFKPLLTMKFFPDESSVVMVRFTMPHGSNSNDTNDMVCRVSQKMMERGPAFVSNTSGMAGLSVDNTWQPVFNEQLGFIQVQLPSQSDREYDDPQLFLNELRSDIVSVLGDTISCTVEFQKDGPPTGAPVHIRMTGINDANVTKLASDLYLWLGEQTDEGETFHGLIELDNGEGLASSMLVCAPNQERLAIHGVAEPQVRQFLTGIFDGIYVGNYSRSDSDIPLRLRLREGLLSNPVHALNIPLINDENGRIVRFGDVGHMESRVDPSQIIRRDFQRSLSITGNFASDSIIGPATVHDLVMAWYGEHAEEYPGALLAFGGEHESTGKSYASLITAFFIGIFLIYLVLATQFRSYAQPLIILSNVIFSFTGVVVMMGIFGLGVLILPDGIIRPERTWFTMQSFIAIVGLTGLVVNDAIVLMDFVNKRRAEGHKLEEAIVLAGHQRLRPILMTTVTTIAGLLPMAIGIPTFTITWSPFATCFIAGLTMSTAMTLLTLPVLYMFYGRLHHRCGFSTAHDHDSIEDESK